MKIAIVSFITVNNLKLVIVDVAFKSSKNSQWPAMRTPAH